MFNHFFCLKDNKIRHGPHMNRQKRYCDLLRFCEDIRWQKLKIECPHNFSSGTDVFNYCYWITHQSSFKICEKPSKFSKSVCVVKDYANTVSAQSKTTPTSCPRSQRLFQHVSTQSTTTRHALFENIKLYFLLLFGQFFTCYKVKLFPVCQRSH